MSGVKRKSMDGLETEDFNSIKIGRTILTSSASSTNNIDINLISGGGGGWNPNLAETLTNKDISDPSNTLPENVVLTSGNQLIFGEKTFADTTLFDTNLTSTGSIVIKNGANNASVVNSATTSTTINLPNTSGTLALTSQLPVTSDFVDLTSAQVITGDKTFSFMTSSNQRLFNPILSTAAPIYGGITLNTSANTTVNNGVLSLPSLGATRTYALPDASGTVVLNNDLANYVDLSTTQTVGGVKTFTSQVLGSNGTVGAPGYSFTNLSNCGMSYDPVTNGLTLSCGGFPILYSRAAGFSSSNPIIPFGRTLAFQRADFTASSLILAANGNDFQMSANGGGARILFPQNIGNTTTGGIQLRTGSAQENGYQVTDTTGATVSVNLNKLGSTTIARASLYLAPVIASVSTAQPYFTYFATPTITGTTPLISATVFIQGAPTNTIVPFALYVASGNSTFIGQVRSGISGSVADPSLAVGSSNTGLFMSGTNLGIANGGSEIARFGSTVGFESSSTIPFGIPTAKSGVYSLTATNGLGGVVFNSPVTELMVSYGGSGVFSFSFRVAQVNVQNNTAGSFDLTLPFTTTHAIGVGQGVATTGATIISAHLQQLTAGSIWTISVRSNAALSNFPILVTGTFYI